MNIFDSTNNHSLRKLVAENSEIEYEESVNSSGLVITDLSQDDSVFTYEYYNSRYGEYLLGVVDTKICFLGFVSEGDRDSIFSDFTKLCGDRPFEQSRSSTDSIAKRIQFSIEKSSAFEGDLYLRGTPFQIEIWRVLLSIPAGTVVSYSHIAHAVGRPTASRAVANAIGRNPISLIVPCHRVVRSSGELGGYRWGVSTKATILNDELTRNR